MLELLVESKTQDIVETKIDVTGNGAYIQAFENRPISVPGYKVVVTVPFNGSANLFSVSPTTMRLTYDDAEVLGNELTFALEFTESNATAEGIKAAVEEKIAGIQHNIDNLNKDLSGFNQRVKDAVTDAVAKRFEQINKLDSIKTALQIPLEKSVSF